MRVTEQVRQYAAARGLTDQQAIEAGLEEKAREFVQRGATLYSRA